jgi:hypothetical protein
VKFHPLFVYFALTFGVQNRVYLNKYINIDQRFRRSTRSLHVPISMLAVSVSKLEASSTIDPFVEGSSNKSFFFILGLKSSSLHVLLISIFSRQ